MDTQELGSSTDSGIHLSCNLTIMQLNYNNNLFNSKKDSEQVSRIKNDIIIKFDPKAKT